MFPNKEFDLTGESSLVNQWIEKLPEPTCEIEDFHFYLHKLESAADLIEINPTEEIRPLTKDEAFYAATFWSYHRGKQTELWLEETVECGFAYGLFVEGELASWATFKS